MSIAMPPSKSSLLLFKKEDISSHAGPSKRFGGRDEREARAAAVAPTSFRDWKSNKECDL
jgi:hypothetical protein